MTGIVAVIGPTAVGKTKLSVEIATECGGEIINADSRQVYRLMDIGTAKPTAEERKQAIHHLLDIRDPNETYSLGSFVSAASDVINNNERNDIPSILCGGSGQYVWGLLEGWNVPAIPPNQPFRLQKECEAERDGNMALHEQLSKIDPVRAKAIDPRNLRRVIRALEIYHVTGLKPSEIPSRGAISYSPLIIGLTMDRSALYGRIDDRVDTMMAEGFLDEVAYLKSVGYTLGQGPLASPGYTELGIHLDGSITLEEAVQKTKYQTHRLARKQYGWFKPSDSRIQWLDAMDPNLLSNALRLVKDSMR
ncbi:MAG: tRNA (adenosine(37)-N6)-dimethylallyltransferase MiaA [Chloroflexota bacterium]|nr:tRNA (adenosine(37)-N6)-dimethylallyltransferase MiaA [Chloroflexota bacterium]